MSDEVSLPELLQMLRMSKASARAAIGALARDGSVPMSGGLDMDGNDLIDVSSLRGMDGEPSVDVSQRLLVDPVGSTAADWSSVGVFSIFSPCSLDSGASFYGDLSLYDTAVMFNGPSFFAGGIGTFGTSELRAIDEAATASVVFNDRSLRDYSAAVSVNWGSRALWDSLGYQSLDWDVRSLHAVGSIVMTWDSSGIQMSANTGVQSAVETVAALGSASGRSGMRRFVSNATATTFGSIVAGGGSNQVPVYSDGTNWRIG